MKIIKVALECWQHMVIMATPIFVHDWIIFARKQAVTSQSRADCDKIMQQYPHHWSPTPSDLSSEIRLSPVKRLLQLRFGYDENERLPDTSATRHLGTWCQSLKTPRHQVEKNRDTSAARQFGRDTSALVPRPGPKCLMDTSVSVAKCPDTSAPVLLCRSVLVSKCLVAEVSGSQMNMFIFSPSREAS